MKCKTVQQPQQPARLAPQGVLRTVRRLERALAKAENALAVAEGALRAERQRREVAEAAVERLEQELGRAYAHNDMLVEDLNDLEDKLAELEEREEFEGCVWTAPQLEPYRDDEVEELDLTTALTQAPHRAREEALLAQGDDDDVVFVCHRAPIFVE